MRLTLAAAALGAIASLSAQAQPSLDGPVCPERSVPFHAFCQWQLRANSGQWISLLAPAGQTVVGTPAADALAAGGEGDIVDGLAGNDSLSSAFNRTALIGGRGNDELSTEASTVGDAVRGIAVQLGGSGNDVHRASLILTGVETASELLIDLGSGDDRGRGNGLHRFELRSRTSLTMRSRTRSSGETATTRSTRWPTRRISSATASRSMPWTAATTRTTSRSARSPSSSAPGRSRTIGSPRATAKTS